MSAPPKPVLVVQGLMRQTSGKRILLVEGPNDQAVYEVWLKKLAAPNPFTAKGRVAAFRNSR